jgi:5-hydroxyisourate hydrolase-like protein (transthyretin family)
VVTAWGTPTQRSGVLRSVLRTASGSPVAGRAVTLQAQWSGTSSWLPVAQLTTDASGVAAAAATYERAGLFRFVSAEDAGFGSAQSTPVFVKVGTRSTATRTSSHRVAGVLQTATGRRLAGQVVELQARRAGTSRWVTAVRLRTGTQGTVSRTVRPRHRTYFRWVYRGTGEQAASASGAVLVR